MTTYVYDKRTGKVVPEAERTDRGDKPKGTYIAQQFRGLGVRHPQLASSPWDNSPAAHYTSYADLDRKAAAQGMVGNRTSERHAPQE